MNTVKARFRSRAGVHPAYNKHLAAAAAITQMPMPELLTVTMAQHLGPPARPVVKKGDTVLRGQLIGEASGFISATVHSPTSGTVKSVAPAPTATGQTAPAVTITPDGENSPDPSIQPCADWRSVGPKDLVEIVQRAGIAGMGGAGFPTHVKLSPPDGKTIDTLIVNGAECEPYLTADYRLMIEHAEDIRNGVEVIRKILGAGAVRIAIEDNKPGAILSVEKAFADMDGDVEVVVLKTEYPQGAEKQQIYAITGREVPTAGLPMDIGAVVENVGTCAAIWKAVSTGMPLIERITTVTGMPVPKPANVVVPIGTSYADLLAFCGGTERDVGKVISGGPMMGFSQASLDVAVTKTTSGLLLLGREQSTSFRETPCISCGRCVDACPTYLMPNELSQFLEAEDYDSAEEYNLMDCIECGCCAFVCPAHRPLVQHMRRGKFEITLKRKQKAAEQKAKAEAK